MSRIVIGNFGGTFASPQAQKLVSELTESWPDVSLMQRTFSKDEAVQASDSLLSALQNGKIHIAMQELSTLPMPLPEGIELVAVLKRREARNALIAKKAVKLKDLPSGSKVAVRTKHDAGFLQALYPHLIIERLELSIQDLIEATLYGDADAVILSAAQATESGYGARIVEILEPADAPPLPGQAAMGLLVKEDDDLAAELAYTVQHRPSYDLAKAELALVTHIAEDKGADNLVSAVANTTGSQQVSFFGAHVAESGSLRRVNANGKPQDIVGKVAAQLKAS